MTELENTVWMVGSTTKITGVSAGYKRKNIIFSPDNDIFPKNCRARWTVHHYHVLLRPLDSWALGDDGRGVTANATPACHGDRALHGSTLAFATRAATGAVLGPMPMSPRAPRCRHRSRPRRRHVHGGQHRSPLIAPLPSSTDEGWKWSLGSARKVVTSTSYINMTSKDPWD